MIYFLECGVIDLGLGGTLRDETELVFPSMLAQLMHLVNSFLEEMGVNLYAGINM